MDSKNEDTSPKTGFEKIVNFINTIEKNHPISITEVVEKTELSWTYVRRILEQLKKDYIGLNFEKSGSTWIAWKDRNKISKKLDDTCGHMLK
ncbi:MAG: hypothetical protein ACFFBP_10060 [Promethearchaeota archaeon]